MRDVEDEDLMRAFLLGDVSPEERERVEERFLRDPDYFETLCGLEDEMVLSHVRGDLPAPWRAAFEAQLQASPERRRRVERTQHLVEALRSSNGVPARSSSGTRPARWPSRTMLGLAAAAALAVVVGGWLVRRPAGPGPQVSSASPADTSPIAALVLAPGLSRSALGPSNVLRATPEPRRIRIEFSEPASTLKPIGAMLRRVGGDPIAVATEPEIRFDGSRIEMSWVIASTALPRGDYLVTLTGETPTHERETIASRFFSIVE